MSSQKPAPFISSTWSQKKYTMPDAQVSSFSDTPEPGISSLIQSFLSKLRNQSDSEAPKLTDLYSSGLLAISKLNVLSDGIKRKRMSEDSDTPSHIVSESDVLEAFSLFSDIKLSNRKIQQSNNSKREQTKSHREDVNSRYLILKARQAELKSLNEQVSGLKRQSGSIEDSNIISEDEFDAKTSDSYLNYTNSHEKMISRLNFELFERKKLQDQLQELGKTKSRINLHSSNFRKDFVKIKNLTCSLPHACTPLNNAVTKLKPPK